jgi:hypothetical protein
MEGERMNGTEDTQKAPRMRVASNSKLPVLTKEMMDESTYNDVLLLLKEGTRMIVQKSEAEDRIEAIKSELSSICEAYELPGIRHGLHSFEYGGYRHATTLSKEKLIELGVSADIIAQAMVPGKTYLSTKLWPFDME